MPKQSKISSTKPKDALPIKEERENYYCCRCERHFKRQKGNFSASQSPLYKGNNGYLPICNHCLEELFTHYKSVLGNGRKAIERICLKFDIYWNPEIYKMLGEVKNTTTSRIRGYISKTNLMKYINKSYDDTLDEQNDNQITSVEEINFYPNNQSNDDEIIINEDIIKYWGVGFTPDMYLELENRRNYWLSKYPENTELTPGEEALLRQICNLEISINKDSASGKSIEKSVNALNNLLGSMNMRPSQKKEVEDNYIPFGYEILKWEDEHPIPEVDKDFEDVDGIHRNVLSWFLGSVCKTVGIKNKYSEFFEEEMAKYTVERPEYEQDDYEDGDV